MHHSEIRFRLSKFRKVRCKLTLSFGGINIRTTCKRIYCVFFKNVTAHEKMREVVDLLRAVVFAVTMQCKFKLAHTLRCCCHFVTYVHTADERARTMLHLFINTVVEIINNGQNYGVST